MTLRIGVIGTGGIGRGHIQRIIDTTPNATIVAVNDINKDIAISTAEEYGARFESDPHHLIQSEDVDAIVIASWDASHEEFCIASIQAGKHVFCEKPLSDTSAGCKRIMDAEIAIGKHLLQVGFMRRYDPGYCQLQSSISHGRIGKPLILHCQHRNKAPTGSKHTTEMSVNGALVHEFDITRFLIGEDDPYISAQLVYPRSSRYSDPDLIDPQLVYLETKNGVRIELEIFMNCQYGYDIQCEVVGEDGTLSLPDPNNIRIKQAGEASYEIVPTWQSRFVLAYEIEIREWVSSVLADQLVGPTAWDGYVTAIVAEACTRSRISGNIEPIELGECPDFYANPKLVYALDN